MAIVKGYYNINNGIFLGPMTATNEATNVMSTPRYVEGVCFGEFNTETEEFVPLTNPMHIPKGVVYEQDEQLLENGATEIFHRGIEEEKGADFVSKKYIPLPERKVTPNVETRDSSGKAYPNSPQTAKQAKPAPVEEPTEIVEAVETKFMTKTELPTDVDFDNLF